MSENAKTSMLNRLQKRCLFALPIVLASGLAIAATYYFYHPGSNNNSSVLDEDAVRIGMAMNARGTLFNQGNWAIAFPDHEIRMSYADGSRETFELRCSLFQGGPECYHIVPNSQVMPGGGSGGGPGGGGAPGGGGGGGGWWGYWQILCGYVNGSLSCSMV